MPSKFVIHNANNFGFGKENHGKHFDFKRDNNMLECILMGSGESLATHACTEEQLYSFCFFDPLKYLE